MFDSPTNKQINKFINHYAIPEVRKSGDIETLKCICEGHNDTYYNEMWFLFTQTFTETFERVPPTNKYQQDEDDDEDDELEDDEDEEGEDDDEDDEDEDDKDEEGEI